MISVTVLGDVSTVIIVAILLAIIRRVVNWHDSPNYAVLKDVLDQPAQDGTGVQTLTFTKPGPANVVVSIDAVTGNPTGEFAESSTFGLLIQGG